MTKRLTVAIPTYRREQVLLETIDHMLALRPEAAEILVIDQTELHQPATSARLAELALAGQIIWVRREVPSITAAMNHALTLAKGDVVLFIDDDVRPEPALLAAHLQAHAAAPRRPGGRPCDPALAGRDRFRVGPDARGSTSRRPDLPSFANSWAATFRCGATWHWPWAVSTRTSCAWPTASKRNSRIASWQAAAASSIEPAACLHHLKAGSGGTRTYGEHLTTWRPDHAVGAYYYGLRTGTVKEFLIRPWRAIATRYHLRHPWRIPATLLAELTGMAWAVALFLRGPRRLPHITEVPHA